MRTWSTYRFEPQSPFDPKRHAVDEVIDGGQSEHVEQEPERSAAEDVRWIVHSRHHPRETYEQGPCDHPDADAGHAQREDSTKSNTR